MLLSILNQKIGKSLAALWRALVNCVSVGGSSMAVKQHIGATHCLGVGFQFTSVATALSG